MKKSRLYWILFSICLMMFCVPVMADSDAESTVTEHVSFVNPEYEQFTSERTQTHSVVEENVGAASVSSAPYYSSVKNAGMNYMRDVMRKRNTSIYFSTYSTSSNWKTVFKEVINQASAYTDDTSPDAGDYLRWNYYMFQGNVSRETTGSGYRYVFNGKITYMTTAAQEKQLAAKIKSVMNSLKIDSMSTEYEIIRAVYDYVTSNVEYDHAMLYEIEYYENEKMELTNSQLTTFSAYKAMIHGKAICQGYANLMYRMLREAGLSVRFIGGTSRGIGHAWNIVRINGKYYNMDSTWDEGADINTYKFFLKGSASGQFPDHTRDDEYRTATFNSKFPMSSVSYLGTSSTATSYKIKYVLNGGTNDSQNPESYFRTAVTLREPTRKGYNFDGWYIDSKFTSRITAIEKTAAKNYTLYAKWEKVSVGKTSITAFKSDSVGLRVYYDTVTDSDGYQLAYAPEKTFDNTKYSYATRNARLIRLNSTRIRRYYVRVRAYKLDSAGSRVYGAWSKAVTGTRIQYQLNGGINGDTNPNYYYNRGTILKDPTREGYTFQGWYTDKNYKNKVTTISRNAGRGVVLYARWKKTS